MRKLHIRQHFVTFVLLAIVMMAGKSLAKYPDGFLYYNDFTGSTIGELPEDVKFSGLNQGLVEVVSTSKFPSGRAVRLLAHKRTEDHTQGDIEFVTPHFPLTRIDPTTIAINYHLKWVQDSVQHGLWFYVRDQGSNYRLIVQLSYGVLHWRVAGVGTPLGSLQSGWNHVRIIANRETERATVFINNMDHPVAENLPFQRPVDSWEGMQLVFRQGLSSAEERETLFGEIKVKIAD